MSKKTLTDADRVAARLLRAIWDREKAKRGFTQEEAADALKMTQGAVSQYIGEKLPLGDVAVLKFSKFLGVAPRDIRPDFEYQICEPKSQFLTESELRHIEALRKLSEDQQAAIKETVNSLAQSKEINRHCG